MVKYMELELGRKLNIFPEKHGVSKYYSWRMIVCHKNMNYEEHLKIVFGTYVLAKNEPKPINKNKPRRFDWIYLQDTDITQGVHKILHL